MFLINVSDENWVEIFPSADFPLLWKHHHPHDEHMPEISCNQCIPFYQLWSTRCHILQTFYNWSGDWLPFDVTNYVALQLQPCCLIILGNETWYMLFELERRWREGTLSSLHVVWDEISFKHNHNIGISLHTRYLVCSWPCGSCVHIHPKLCTWFSAFMWHVHKMVDVFFVNNNIVTGVVISNCQLQWCKPF